MLNWIVKPKLETQHLHKNLRGPLLNGCTKKLHISTPNVAIKKGEDSW